MDGGTNFNIIESVKQPSTLEIRSKAMLNNPSGYGWTDHVKTPLTQLVGLELGNISISYGLIV